MPKVGTFVARVAAPVGITACALVTKFDPPATPCPSTALLCEDFETGYNSSKWTDSPQMGGSWSIEKRPQYVHWGGQSLHLHSDATTDTGDTDVAWEATRGPWPSQLYVRAFVYGGSPLANDVANFLQLQNQGRSQGYVLYAGKDQFGWTAWAGNTFRGSPTPPQPAEWTCVEWAFDGADVEVSIGGVPNPTLGDTNAPIVPFSELDVGLLFEHTVGEPSMDLWLDDIVLDTKPIACGG